MKGYLEFETDIYTLEDVYKYNQSLSKKEEDSDEDPADKLVRRALYGEEEEQSTFLPKPVKARILIDPDQIIGVTESLAAFTEPTSTQIPKKDALILLLRNGSEQPVNCTLRSFKRKLTNFRRKQEKQEKIIYTEIKQ
jgi:hypothetical protein